MHWSVTGASSNHPGGMQELSRGSGAPRRHPRKRPRSWTTRRGRGTSRSRAAFPHPAGVHDTGGAVTGGVADALPPAKFRPPSGRGKGTCGRSAAHPGGMRELSRGSRSASDATPGDARINRRPRGGGECSLRRTIGPRSQRGRQGERATEESNSSGRRSCCGRGPPARREPAGHSSGALGQTRPTNGSLRLAPVGFMLGTPGGCLGHL